MGVGNSTTVVKNGFIWVTMGNEAMLSLYDLRWMIVALIVLLATDAYNGTRESFMLFDEAMAKNNRKEAEKYRFHLSRFIRRTVCKLIEYLTYLLIGCVLGIAVLEPCGICDHIISSAIGLGIGATCEISSIIGHLLKLHHIVIPRLTPKTIGTFFGNVIAIFIKKYDKNLGEAVEEGVYEAFNKKDNDGQPS